MSVGRILVVDDELQVRRLMRTILVSAGYEVEDAKSGKEGIEKMSRFHPDMVLLDINMPGMGGLAACKAMRSNKDVAIIALAIHDSEEDRVTALDAGADDFVLKPFSTPELLARIRAALRRVPGFKSTPKRIRIGTLVVDFIARSIYRGNGQIHLTPKELELLRYLIQHANQAVSHVELLQAVWGTEYRQRVEHLRGFVKNLRKKIEADPDHPKYIITTPWIGYSFNGTPEPF